MDRIDQHLQTIPAATLVALGCVAVLFALFVPKKLGLYFSLFLVGSWLNLNRFTEIPFLASAAKVTFWLPPMLLIFFAQFMPGPRNSIPKSVWPFLLCPFIGFACVIGAEDRLMGIVQFATMLVMAAGAISLYRITTNSQAMFQYLSFIFLGLLVPIGIAFFDLVAHGAGAFRLGVNRFEPFGMASNQYVHLFATASCLAACGYLICTQKWKKVICLGVIGSCGAMLVASGSRQGLIIVFVSLLPAFWYLRKHPFAVALGVVACLGVGIWVFKYVEGITTERMTDFSNTSGRYDVLVEYIHIILKRPVAGLMGTSGESVIGDDQASHISHNSYIRMVYLGGALLVVPLFFAQIMAFLSMIFVLRRTEQTYLPAILIWSMSALLMAIFLQGLVNDMIYFSVSSWTFLHYFLACFFSGLAVELKQARVSSWEYAPMGRQTAWG